MDGLCCCASRHKTPEAEMLFDDPIGSPAGKKKKDSSPNRVMDGYVKFDNVAEEDPVPQVAPAPPPRTGKVVIDIEVTTATPKREVLDIEVTVDSAGGAGENVASSGVLTGSVHAAVTGGASTFTAALRSALGVDGGAHDAAVSTASSGTFDAAVEEELRALFRRCDRDKNGIMGRAEFSRALQILKLEKHLGLIGKSSGLLGGIEKLFSDLASGGNGVDEEHFVKVRSFQPQAGTDRVRDLPVSCRSRMSRS